MQESMLVSNVVTKQWEKEVEDAFEMVEPLSLEESKDARSADK